MNKLYLKRAATIWGIILAVILIFGEYLDFVAPRTSLNNLNSYAKKNTVDVFFVGSSHVFCSINPIHLYAEHGIASYDLVCGSQSPCQSYYYLKNALKKQSPKLVVLDVYMFKYEYQGYAYGRDDTITNLATYPLGIDKIRAVYEDGLTPDPVATILGWPAYHSNFPENFTFMVQNHDRTHKDSLGYQYTTDITPLEDEICDVRSCDEVTPIDSRCEYYLRQIIDLCHEKGIEIALINAPWALVNEESQAEFNYIKTIAEEYKIDFYDGCVAMYDIGFDDDHDWRDEHGHLGHSGAAKWTDWLYENIPSLKAMPDHRGDHHYSMWENVRK